MRKRTDATNAFFAGGMTMMFLAIDTGIGWRGLMTTGIGGGLFTMVMDSLMGGFH